MHFEWDPHKNEKLKAERNVSFEQAVFHLMKGDIWRIGPHPNQEKYSGQQIYFINIGGYIYLVPFERVREKILLKTIIPSRKATRDYRNKGGQL